MPASDIQDVDEEESAEDLHGLGLTKCECREYWRTVDSSDLLGFTQVEAVLVLRAYIEHSKDLEPDLYEYVFSVAPMDPTSMRSHIDNIVVNITPVTRDWKRASENGGCDPVKRGFNTFRGHRKGYELKGTYPVYVRWPR